MNVQTYNIGTDGLLTPDTSLSQLRRDGLTSAPWFMDQVQLHAMIAHLDECWVWPNHVATKARDQSQKKLLKDARTDGLWPAFAPVMDDVVTAPHFFEYALKCFPLAKDYFGEFPRLYSINCFWTQPAVTQYPETHDWHRDGDDPKQFGMFLFGTDVLTDADGPHLYQRATHRHPDGSMPEGHGDTHAELNASLPWFAQSHTNPPPECIIKFFGPAGTLFFEDPNGIHLGTRPTSHPRMFAWARWGISNPPQSYALWDKLRPVPRALLGDRYPADPELQEAIRLVVS